MKRNKTKLGPNATMIIVFEERLEVARKITSVSYTISHKKFKKQIFFFFSSSFPLFYFSN